MILNDDDANRKRTDVDLGLGLFVHALFTLPVRMFKQGAYVPWTCVFAHLQNVHLNQARALDNTGNTQKEQSLLIGIEYSNGTACQLCLSLTLFSLRNLVFRSTCSGGRREGSRREKVNTLPFSVCSAVFARRITIIMVVIHYGHGQYGICPCTTFMVAHHPETEQAEPETALVDPKTPFGIVL